MRHDSVLETIDAWVERGWLRPLDRAFSRFLATLDPELDSLGLLAATLTSHQLGRGHICLDLTATLASPDETLSLPPEGEANEPTPIRPSSVLAGRSVESLRESLSRSPLVGHGIGNTPLVLDGDRLYLRRYWVYEQRIAQAIRDRLAQIAPVPPDLKARLDALFEKRPGSAEPDWQKIACALAARGFFTIITGGPGTGKTTTVTKLLALLQGAAREAGQPLRIRLAAPTGKAAARLTESIGKAVSELPEAMRTAIPTEATTLHRLLGARPDTRRFTHHADNPLHADLVVVDEASMIDLEMMAALLDALRPDTRLVLLGDKDQLASVEAGSVLGDLCRCAKDGYRPDTVDWLRQTTGEHLKEERGEGNALAERIVTLRVSWRFSENSGIGHLARSVNAGQADEVESVWGHSRKYPDIARIRLQGVDDPRLERLAIDGGQGHFPGDASRTGDLALGYRHYLETLRNRRPSPTAGREAQEAWARAVLDAFDQFQLLTPLRQGAWGVEGLNEQIAAALHRAGWIDQTHGWYEGRPVLVTRNDYSLGLMNGDIGIALRCADTSEHSETTRLRVVFRQPDQTLKYVLPSRLTEVETVYAMTVHKSQGSEFTHVALVLPDKLSPILTRELLYTGITRAKRWFSLLLSDERVLEQSIFRQVQRSGGLAALLEA